MLHPAPSTYLALYCILLELHRTVPSTHHRKSAVDVYLNCASIQWQAKGKFAIHTCIPRPVETPESLITNEQTNGSHVFGYRQRWWISGPFRVLAQQALFFLLVRKRRVINLRLDRMTCQNQLSRHTVPIARVSSPEIARDGEQCLGS